jgi:hypothetical protein
MCHGAEYQGAAERWTDGWGIKDDGGEVRIGC